MQTMLEQIESQAMQLSAEERARLVEHLLESLDADDEIDAAWEEEAGKRVARLDAGDAIPVSLDVALDRAAARLR